MDYRTFVDQVIKKVTEKTGMDEQNVYYQEADESMKEDAIIVIFGESETDFLLWQILPGRNVRGVSVGLQCR